MSTKETENKYINHRNTKEAYIRSARRVNSHVIFGVIAFLVILLYLLFSIFSFTFNKKTAYTFAEFGQINKNETFQGIILRNETVYYAEDQGPSKYFVLEGDKVKKDTPICLVDVNRVLTNNETYNEEDVQLSEDQKEFLNTQFRIYIENLREKGIGYLGIGRSVIANTSEELYASDSLANKKELLQLILENNPGDSLALYKTDESGLVSFYLDGLEELNINTVTPNDLSPQEPINFTYTLENQKEVGDPLYKLIDNYQWFFYASVSEKFVSHIGDRDNVTINFIKKNIKINGKIMDLIEMDSQYYIKLEFNHYLDHFLTDRYAEFTITYENYEGLKIPNSSVVTKEFVGLPRNAIFSNRGQLGVNIVDETVELGFKFIPITFYYINEDNAYIPLSETISLKNTIRYDDNGNVYQVELLNRPTMTHEGVYVINKGYAAFSLIETLVYDNDYRIIKTNTRNGVMMYDRIASDAANVTENQLIN